MDAEAGLEAASDEETNASSEASGSEEEQSQLPKDELFHLLQSARRRRALQYLLNRGDTVDMRAMTEQLAAIENDVDVAALTSAQRKRVYISLYQCHLPKLDEAAVIDYNKARGRIAPTRRIAQLEPYLTVDVEADGADVRPELPAVAAVLGAVLTAAAWTSVLPAPGLWLPVGLTVLFGLATFVAAIN